MVFIDEGSATIESLLEELEGDRGHRVRGRRAEAGVDLKGDGVIGDRDSRQGVGAGESQGEIRLSSTVHDRKLEGGKVVPLDGINQERNLCGGGGKGSFF